MKNPINLDECVEFIDSLDIPDREKFLKDSEDSAIALSHHRFGTFIRNELGLWRASKLTNWFNEQGIEHADDMSGIILTTYHRRKNGREISLDEQVKEYQDYWKEMSLNVH